MTTKVIKKKCPTKKGTNNFEKINGQSPLWFCGLLPKICDTAVDIDTLIVERV